MSKQSPQSMATANAGSLNVKTQSNREDDFTREEIELAFRNHGAPMEALAYDVTPVGMHYQVIHFDIPNFSHLKKTTAVTGDSNNNYFLEIVNQNYTPHRVLKISLHDIRTLFKQTSLLVTMECAGNGRTKFNPRVFTSIPWNYQAFGTAKWTGTLLFPLLEQAGILDENASDKNVIFTGADLGIQGGEVQYYERGISVKQILHYHSSSSSSSSNNSDNKEKQQAEEQDLQEPLKHSLLLAHSMNDAELLPQHGYPLRLVVPSWYGMASVKWLTRITITNTSAVQSNNKLYQNYKTYRYMKHAKDIGSSSEAVTVKRMRALMVPPGIADFFARTRVLELGSIVKLEGKVWGNEGSSCNSTAVEHVEVAIQRVGSKECKWNRVTLVERDNNDALFSKYAWQSWYYELDLTATSSPSSSPNCTVAYTPGNYIFMVRAVSKAHKVQPMQQEWNYGGMGNNSVQRIHVTMVPKGTLEHGKQLPSGIVPVEFKGYQRHGHSKL